VKITRTTTNYIKIPDPVPPILERNEWSTSLFRVETIQETLVERDSSPAGYSVVLSGPKQTISGKDHANQRGRASYGERYSQRQVTELKPEIVALLAGQDGLSGWSPAP